MKRKTLLLLTISVIAAATVLAQNQPSGGLVAGANYSYLKAMKSNNSRSTGNGNGSLWRYLR
jgi:hypothetical protein